MISVKEKLMWSIGASLLIILVIISVDCFLVSKIRFISQEYLNNQIRLEQFYQKEEISNDLQMGYEGIESNLADLGNAFLNTDNTVEFITDLEKVAQETNNIFEVKSVSSFDPSKQDITNPFLGFQITLWGDFNNLISFLSNLEDSPYPPYRLTEIENINIKRLDSKQLTGRVLTNISSLKEGDLETTLHIKVYTQ
ncbi:MAG: hypothetical protein ABH887_00720 [bacterium]